MNIKDIIVILRSLKVEDLPAYYRMNHPSRKFHQFNGPYFKKMTLEELRNKVDCLEEQLKNDNPKAFKNRKIIANQATNEIIGCVNWYWKSEETNWMEIGIVIFNEAYWGYGIGYKALKLWIDEIFNKFPSLVRLGLTTWSGNIGMMKLAEKLGFQKESCYRNARIVDGTYYDSVSYGILKNEWEDLKKSL